MITFPEKASVIGGEPDEQMVCERQTMGIVAGDDFRIVFQGAVDST